MRVVPGSSTAELAKIRSANATDTSFPARPVTTTEPAGNGVLDLRQFTPSNLVVIPFGSGSDNTTFDLRIIAWNRIGTLWVPTILAQASCTLSASVGVSGQSVTDTDRFADTVTLSLIASAGVDAFAKSPANDTPATIVVDALGAEKIEIVFDLTGAAGANALVKGV